MTLIFEPFGSSAGASEKMAQIELDKFALYEFNERGLEHFFEAEKGQKFENYYDIENGKFSSNSRSYFETIRSDYARYNEDSIHLKGNVLYEREDGLTFRSQDGEYNQNQSTIKTDHSFVITKGSSRVEGNHLFYDLENENVSADKVRGTYYFN